MAQAVNIWQATHEKVFMETAEHLQLNSNLIVAVLALQSWCSFVSRWLYMMNAVYEAESPSLGSEENLLKAAKYLVKVLDTLIPTITIFDLSVSFIMQMSIAILKPCPRREVWSY